MDQSYPRQGIYCPAKEDHEGRRGRIMAAFSEDAIFLHCSEHDWLRVELYIFGKKISFKGVTAVVNQVKPKQQNGKVLFDLMSVPIQGKGCFTLKSRKWRENTK